MGISLESRLKLLKDKGITAEVFDLIDPKIIVRKSWDYFYICGDDFYVAWNVKRFLERELGFDENDALLLAVTDHIENCPVWWCDWCDDLDIQKWRSKALQEWRTGQ